MTQPPADEQELGLWMGLVHRSIQWLDQTSPPPLHYSYSSDRSILLRAEGYGGRPVGGRVCSHM